MTDNNSDSIRQDLGAIPGSRERGQEVVPALTGFDPAREEAHVSGPSGNRRSVLALRIGRLIVHPALNVRGDFAVSHAATGGQLVSCATEAAAIEAAEAVEQHHSDALELLDLLEWGQNLTTAMRTRPAIRELRKFRDAIATAAGTDETRSGSAEGKGAGRRHRPNTATQPTGEGSQ